MFECQSRCAGITMAQLLYGDNSGIRQVGPRCACLGSGARKSLNCFYIFHRTFSCQNFRKLLAKFQSEVILPRTTRSIVSLLGIDIKSVEADLMIVQRIVAYLIIVFGAIATATPALAQLYPNAQIKNNSPYTVRGKVIYISAFCRDDRFAVGPGKTWRARKRGSCLINRITGKFPGGTRSRHGERLLIADYRSSSTSTGRKSAMGRLAGAAGTSMI